jgi:iron complex transport system ATP-binding protein
MNLLSFEKVTVPGRVRARLFELDLEIGLGECVFVLGPNGAGKSTLLRTALALEAPASGAVMLNGDSVFSLSPRERAARVAWLPQDRSFDPRLLSWEIVAAARFRFGESHEVARAAALQALKRVGADAFATCVARELSGGEQQRVKLACLLAQEAPLVLLDEPGNHLDPVQELEAYRLLGELWSSGLTLLCVTHDINLVSLVGAKERIRVLGLDAGRLSFDTRLSDVNLPEHLSRLFGAEFRQTFVADETRGTRSLFHAAPGIPGGDGGQA